ncbi:MAG: enoyl-CoA hydratase/isomerase family protein [Deltaproteobacteria bacterium]|nr:enoyl-CoA hydratase/isomerase family protein [Deltaproteobacteria bacterium]
MAYEYIEIAKDGHVATLTLNRPERLNALGRDLMLELIDAAHSFAHDTETRVVIFTGAGRHFCAGADLKDDTPRGDLPASRLQLRRSLRAGPDLVRAIHEIDQITIAAVNGGALGGGACIATACDFRIGASDSFCGYPEIDRGMNLQWVALPLCVHLIGPARAKRMIMLGQKENAKTLLDWAFYDEVAGPDELLARARAMADEYAAKPPIAAQMIKQSVNAVASALDRAVMHMDLDQWMLTATTDDYREGIKAFLEKRAARFEGN